MCLQSVKYIFLLDQIKERPQKMDFLDILALSKDLNERISYPKD